MRFCFMYIGTYCVKNMCEEIYYIKVRVGVHKGSDFSFL